MEWKVFLAHENIVLGEGLTKFQAQLLALEWAASAIEIHPGYVPGWIVDVTASLLTVIYREEEAAVCRRDGTQFHLQLPCRCVERITSLDDRRLPR
jgi:hypothetical protein